MRRSALALAVPFVLLAGCGSAAATQAPAPAAPAFDTITLDVNGGSNPAVIMFDFDNGLAPDAKTWQISQRTPFHTEVTKPHGPHNMKITASSVHGGGTYINCTLRVNGQVVASGEQASTGLATCAYSGTTGQ